MQNNLSNVASDIDAEQQLLGSLLFNNGAAIPVVADRLSPDDFLFPPHQNIFRAFLALYNKGVTVNNHSLMEELKRNNSDPSTLKIAIDLEEFFTNAYAQDDAKKIKDNSLRRQAISWAKKFQNDLDDLQKETSDILSSAQKAFKDFDCDIAPTALISPYSYFSERLDADIEKTKSYAERQTGFSNIDEQQIFSPGLYVLGATPACGKTTFAWQLLEQLALRGETCIFCSYEMSALELFTKTLSRKLFLRDENSSLTAADIRKGNHSSELQKLKQEIKDDKNLKGVNVFELRDETVDDLLRLLKPHCTGKDKAPVVVVDYLQIIPAANDKKLISDKAKIDDIVHKLKTFQRETNTTFIVISSFNRMNYYSQISFESFKESGNIEYTADVVWALQLNVANDIKIGAGISEVRKLFDDAKKQQPRQLQLKCLKNRNGMNYDAYFNYFSKHDFFQSCTLDDFTQDNIDIPPLESNSSAHKSNNNDDNFHE